MSEPRVHLVGGCPGAGKTTLGKNLAVELGVTSLSIDDLFHAARAVTTPETHPGLHVMARVNSIEYFTEGPVEKLTADADTQHAATWPAVEKVIRNHAVWGDPIVIDGWFLRPQWVADLNLDNVAPFWLVVERTVLEERERKLEDFYGRSREPERMLRNFLGRSFWYNDFIEEEAARLGMPILRQDGTRSVEDLMGMVLDTTF